MAQMTRKDSHVLVLLISAYLLVLNKGSAFEFRVGGSKGTWAVPPDPNASIYNQWAQKNRFQIGDSLLFVYVPGQDSVLHVTKEDYTNCNTASPLEKFNDGHTVFSFNQSGSHYFISGVPRNCLKNEKIVVIVMADRSKHNSNGQVASPSPSPSPSPLEKVSPPTPAPAGEESPPPPFGVEINPTPAPSQEYSPPAPSQESSPPRNGAALIVSTGVFGTVMVFLSSMLVLTI